jgi:hypothetical protein
MSSLFYQVYTHNYLVLQSQNVLLYLIMPRPSNNLKLDCNKLQKNPGLRALAKLMLNNFWGKFGERTNLPQVEYVLSDP